MENKNPQGLDYEAMKQKLREQFLLQYAQTNETCKTEELNEIVSKFNPVLSKN
jgi:hypothetical protein